MHLPIGLIFIEGANFKPDPNAPKAPATPTPKAPDEPMKTAKSPALGEWVELAAAKAAMTQAYNDALVDAFAAAASVVDSMVVNDRRANAINARIETVIKAKRK